MPFTWSININPDTSSPEVQFDPDPLLNVDPGDQLFWANNDKSSAHWPGLLNSDGSINATFFMPNQIAPNSTSEAFSPSVGGTLNYACSLHPDEKGSIVVSQGN